MLGFRKRTLVSSTTLALAVCALYFACAQAATEPLSQAARADASLPNSTTITVTATNPAQQALNVPLTNTVAATFSAGVNAGTVSTATFVVQTMQSGLVTGTFGYDAPARTVTLTPTRAFHTGEVIRAVATAGLQSTEGMALAPYQWQFTAGQVNPIAPCGFVDIDAGLTSVQNSSVAWGDYDNDGRLDILLTGVNSSGIRVSKIYRNEGSGMFTEIAAGLTGVSWGSAAWGDYDNDGRPDILLTGEQGFLNPVSKVYHNNGDGTFTDIGAGLTGVEYSSTAWGDYDNDGWLDILLTGYDPNYPVTELWHNQGDGTFAKITTALPDVGEGAVAWGDYDNDGTPDLLLTGYNSAGYRVSQLWRNQGNSSFTQAVTLTGTSDGSVAWGDYDNDGRLDILLTGYSGDDAIPLSQVLRNDGNGIFTDINAGLSGVAYSAAAWGDYNSDGYLDILLTGTDSHDTALAEVYRNDGHGSFVRFGGAALTGVWYGSVAWGDYDGNGRLGILLTGRYKPYTSENPVSRVYRSADECHSDLKIAKSAAPTAAVPGATVTYILEFSNLGSLIATDVVISDSVPVDIIGPVILSHSGATITQTGSAPNFSWQVEDLVAGRGGTIIITGTLATLDPDVVVTNIAEINSPLDVNLSNNHPAARVTVLASPPADLGITKIVTPTAAVPGSVVTYTLAFSNTGSGKAVGVTLNDRVPVSITAPTIVGSSGAVITQTGSAPDFAWQVADLAVGQGGVITLTGVLSAALPAGAVITNTAEITAAVDSDPTNNHSSTEVTVRESGYADLGITKIVTPTLAYAGAAVTYTLIFSNTGSGKAVGVTLNDRVPVSITAPTIVGSSGAVITPTSSAPDFAWQVADLAVGQGGVITLTGVLSAALPAGAVITNTAEITAPIDSAAGNNRSSAEVTVRESLPPVPPAINIRRQNSNIIVSWADQPANSGGYLAWYSAKAYFQPFNTGAISVTLPVGTTSYTHSGAVGGGSTYFYLVQGVNGVGVLSAVSNRVGAVGFSLTPGAP